MGITWIGEQVKSLRNSCTGRRAGALLSESSAASRWALCSAWRRLSVASAARRLPRRRRPAVPSSSRDAERGRFLPARKARRCGCRPRPAMRREQLIALLSSAELDGLDPDDITSRAAAGARDGARGQAQGCRARRPHAVARRSSLMSRDLKRDPGHRDHLRRSRSCGRAAVAAGGAARRRGRAVAATMCATWAGCTRSTAELRKALAEHDYAERPRARSC